VFVSNFDIGAAYKEANELNKKIMDLNSKNNIRNDEDFLQNS
jgi:hypothetical protein